MGTYPAPQDFPVRHSIIAGMARGVVRVEGAQYSGSLIIARLAMECGREVFAAPGDATQPASCGPNQLVKQGAKLLTGWVDVVEELPAPIRAEPLPVETTDGAQRASLVTESLAPAERTLYALREGDKSKHRDELVEQSRMNSSNVLSALCELEMRGSVQRLPGKQFLKKI